MRLKPESPSKTPDISGLSAAELLSVVEGLQQELAAKSAEIQQRDHALAQGAQAVKQRDHTIQILEELLRWKRIQQFGASSEKSAHQIHLFDEAELEVEIDALRDQLPVLAPVKIRCYLPQFKNGDKTTFIAIFQ
ncbi:transposase IS166 family protein [Marinobacter sp. LV10MA510-1]|nr:transposase IS166 family protein [Marinobacter sp. LV10MA510-1]PFG54709.1 transposase IS166 family protein [Marinobacter sp. LV10R520-4]